tara:strand:+ start:18 stop:683 length:666 start_codon:yes stop_codon:yes gene_type:complete
MNALIEKNIYMLAQDFFKGRPKEKMDMILEPMQVMIQLALLSFCPIGTKLSVRKNILGLDHPTYSQGVTRWLNQDSKNDLHFLYNVLRRYYKWYKKDSNNKIYSHILELGKKGIGKLIQTYEQSNEPAITKILRIYYSILNKESYDLFISEEETTTIDNVFQYVVQIYNMKLMMIVYNILRLIETEKNEPERRLYFAGLELILTPFHEKIQLWITKNLSSI